jgi:hypothetical protein
MEHRTMMFPAIETMAKPNPIRPTSGDKPNIATKASSFDLVHMAQSPASRKTCKSQFYADMGHMPRPNIWQNGNLAVLTKRKMQKRRA